MRLVALSLLCAVTLYGASKTPINNGVLQSDLNAAGFKITNANLVDYAGTNMTWNAVTGKFDATGGGGTGYHSVTFIVDGSGYVLSSGVKNPVKVPFGGTLVGWVMMCKPSGSVTADVFRSANTAGLPVTSIVGGSGTKPAVSTNVESSSTSFTSWTSTTITAKDNLCISLSGITTATYVQLTLYYQ